MGKGKKAKAAFLASLVDATEGAQDQSPSGGDGQMSRKEKRQQKLAKKEANKEKSSKKEEEEDEQLESEEEQVNVSKTNTQFQALNMDDSDDDDNAEEDEDESDGKSKKKKKSKKEKSKKSKRDKKGDDEDEDDEEDNEDDDEEEASEKGKSKKKGSKKKQVYYGEADEFQEDRVTVDEMFDEDGKKKKLSNKERRKLQAANEAALEEMKYREMAASKKTEFAVSATTGIGGEAWENATDINIPSFTISAYGKTLFKNAELKIAHGRRYGLVGPNGMGKTTILKQIANGELKIPPKIDCLYVEQEVTADDTPAVEMVLQADTKRTALLNREQEIMNILDSDQVDDMPMEQHEALHEELQKVTTELRAMGSDSAEARALALLNGLGFTEEMQRAPTKSFSGGWRMRVSLARALFMTPTLLLLDEPTNHLDLNAVIWLDDYLQKWKNTLLIVSHDQDFLDSVCTDIIHLDQQKLYYYRGNYEQFKDQYQLTRIKLQKDYEKQEKELKALKSKGKTIAKAKEQMAAKNKRETGGARRKKQDDDDAGQSAGGKGLADRELIQRPKDYVVNFEFPPVDKVSPPIIQVDNVTFGYPDRKPLFKKLSFGIDMDSRITIVGANGIGKSTLLKVLTQELEPSVGEVKVNRRVRIARYHQHFLDILPMGLSPVEFLREKHTEVTYQEARNRLGRFGLEGHAHTIKMLNLSGGQKSRVVFASLSYENPHILIFDEPTNNLDLESIDALCEAINEFEGGVVLVSHDARLITTTECRLWVLDRKKVTELPGGFEAYKESLLNDLRKIEEDQQRKQAAKQALAIEQREKKIQLLAERREKKIKAAKSSA